MYYCYVLIFSIDPSQVALCKTNVRLKNKGVSWIISFSLYYFHLSPLQSPPNQLKVKGSRVLVEILKAKVGD